MVISVTLIDLSDAVRHVLHVGEDTLYALIAAFDLARFQVVFTRASAWPEILTRIHQIALWKCSVARQLPHFLDAIISIPRLGVIPEVVTHACQVRRIHQQSTSCLLFDGVSCQCLLTFSYWHREIVACCDPRAETSQSPSTRAVGARPCSVLVCREEILSKVLQRRKDWIDAEPLLTNSVCRVVGAVVCATNPRDAAKR